MSRKGNKADFTPSRRERKGITEYILGFFNFYYIHCSVDYPLYWYSSQLSLDEAALTRTVSSFFPEKGSNVRI